MGSLTQNVSLRCRVGGSQSSYVAASAVYQGAMLVMLAATGNAQPAEAASAGTNGRVVGVAQTSAALGERITAERGVYAFKNTSANPVTWAHVGSKCYAANDAEVTADPAGGVVAGVVVDVEVEGAQTVVWVDSRY